MPSVSPPSVSRWFAITGERETEWAMRVWQAQQPADVGGALARLLGGGRAVEEH